MPAILSIKDLSKTYASGFKALKGINLEIHRGEEHLISGQSIYVYAQDGKSLPIPDDLRRRIHGFEKIPPR